MPLRPLILHFAAIVWLGAAASDARADKTADLISTIAKVGPQGAGSQEARAACDALSAQDAKLLPQLLAAMETPNPVAANWYRMAYEAIVARETAKADAQIPVVELKAFVSDPTHAGRVRRLALALCDRFEPGYSKSLVPRLLDDPEFRNDAVDAALAAGQQAIEQGDSETARASFQQAFRHSRESQQTVRAADKLIGLGEQVDIAAHLGLVVDWWLIGPFDAPEFTGFDREFPPEQAVDLKAQYTGQSGDPIAWTRHRTNDPLGMLNLVQALAPATEAVGYAYAEIESPRERAAQLRCGADDSCAVWLNGEKVFGRKQWLNGSRFDRFTTPISLKQGTNTLLVKICQGPQHKDPQVTNNWTLQLRFCDEDGAGVTFRSGLPPIAEAK